MKSIFTLLFFLITSITCSAQETYKYGLLNSGDLKLKAYDKDSSAEAVILFDVGETSFIHDSNGGLDVQFKRTKRIKILKESAVELANISISYYEDGYGRTEKIEDLKARSINLENEQMVVKELDKKEVYIEEYNENWRGKKFAIPNVKEGTIIEYTYTLISPFTWNLQDWEFQSSIPTLYSQYIVKMIPFYEYIILYQGMQEAEIAKKSYEDKGLDRSFAGIEFQDMVYEFEMKDIPAFIDDEFITAPGDYIKKIEFQRAKVNQPNGSSTEYISTWPQLTDRFNKEDSFGKFIKSFQKLGEKEIIPNLLAGKNLSEMEVIELITNYVRDNFRWNGYYRMFATQKPRELISSHSGASSDLNLLLTGLLRAANIETKPVLISTRGHGKIYPNYPITNKFNYVIAMAQLSEDKGILLLDGTEPKLPYYLLPTRCYNDQGFVVDENEQSWLEMTPIMSSTKVENSIIKLSGEELVISVREQFNGYDALSERNSLDDDEEAYKASKFFKNEEQLSEVKLSNTESYNANFGVSYKKSRPVDTFDGEYYFVPFNRIEYAQNPLKNHKRDYPIDLVYTKKRVFSSTIAVEEGKSFKHIPESLNHKDELMTFDYNVSEIGEFIKIEANYEFKKNIYLPEEYDQLKKDFEMLYQKLNEQIIVVDKS
ncbi:DUF3857 domain-containing protein [Reichenbachiella ulvae]|uniref:DUF3857 domain-containing protein n=1 Tax=Reichenbachiella ulvae TaxID=2980104 RepID=A0ABT3CVR4_9BACT|nr:DUF3857 domain-containing protein [Reichenbachiella ulvae]MCV9387792.1 DUF3857 domain-containing protein [Reichenbachiella ulvae]